MNFLEIEKVIGREIIDSRGNPTVEAAPAHPATYTRTAELPQENLKP